ncbi:hypothetical protein B566_EDAN016052 [Ephemera danica]|nr:hypothetical protein B566_EDAN016052 [Ephemera danica]
MKKWRRGKGTMFTASLRRSAFNCPGKRRQVVTPDIVRDTRWFRSPSLSVVTFGPVVSSAALTKNEVVRSENLTERSGTDGVHGAWFQIDEDGARNILATGRLVVVHVDALQLELAVAMRPSSTAKRQVPVRKTSIINVPLNKTFTQHRTDVLAALHHVRLNTIPTLPTTCLCCDCDSLRKLDRLSKRPVKNSIPAAQHCMHHADMHSHNRVTLQYLEQDEFLRI